MHDIDFEALLGLPLDDFIRQAYQIILLREAEEAGFEAALKYLKKSGRRILYLHQLAASAEGQAAVKPQQLCADIASAFAGVRLPFIGPVRERRRIDGAVAAAQEMSAGKAFSSGPVIDASAYFAFSADRLYDMDAYYQLNGEKFLRAAYLSICDRLPSAGEMRAAKARLRKGISRAVLLSDLLRSHEGRSRRTRIAGVFPLAFIEAIAEAPIIGHVVMLVVLSVNLNKTLRYVRAMEYEVYASFNDEEG